MTKDEKQKLPGVSFFCPAYLDEGNIERVVLKALEVLREHAERFEIIIVEDGSPDNTAAVADRLAAEHPQVRAIHHGQNRGYGEAIKTGLGAASLDIIAFADGDDQYDPRDLARMFPHLQDHDAVIGYRLNLANSTPRNLLSRAYNYSMRRMFNTPFRDLSCAIKLFKRGTLDALEVRAGGIFTQSELVLRAYHRGFRIAQVGVPAYPRLHGRSNSITWKNFRRLVREALSLWWELRGA